MTERFYVHSEEFWGYPPRKWAVFERLALGRWKRVSKFFKDSGDADKLCARMNADNERYQSALLESCRA
jgi:hypothetical protein